MESDKSYIDLFCPVVELQLVGLLPTGQPHLVKNSCATYQGHSVTFCDLVIFNRSSNFQIYLSLLMNILIHLN